MNMIEYNTYIDAGRCQVLFKKERSTFMETVQVVFHVYHMI